MLRATTRATRLSSALSSTVGRSLSATPPTFHHGRRHLQPPRALRQGVRPRCRRAPRRRQGVQARRLRRQGVRRRHGLHGARCAAFFRFPRRRGDRRVASPRDPSPRRTRSRSRRASSDVASRRVRLDAARVSTAPSRVSSPEPTADPTVRERARRLRSRHSAVSRLSVVVV